jgi:hypothetical protein
MTSEISQIKEMTKRDFSSVEMTSEISQIKEMTKRDFSLRRNDKRSVKKFREIRAAPFPKHRFSLPRTATNKTDRLQTAHIPIPYSVNPCTYALGVLWF